MRKLSFIFFLFLSIALYAKNDINFDSLYSCLDKEIGNSSKYVENHEKSIAALKSQMSKATDSEMKYKLSFDIYLKYKSFINDSAIYYLDKSIFYAMAMKRDDLVASCKTLLSFQCSTSGMYTESLDIIKSIDMNSLPKDDLASYYIALNHVYTKLTSYCQEENLKKIYADKALEYMDSIFKFSLPGGEDYLLKKEMQYYDSGEFNKALECNDRRLVNVVDGTHEFAIVAYYRSQIYSKMNDFEQAKYWLIRSAICDIKNAVMDHVSLLNLALLLNNEGDVDRSYYYIKFSWHMTTVFNARVRSWLTSPVLSMINDNYQSTIKRKNSILLFFVIAISILSLFFLIGVFYVNNQRKRLSLARKQLKKINSKLEDLNAELFLTNKNLDKSNQDLSLLNEKLSYSNSKLNEANLVKEEYIGRFMNLCTDYINKLDWYRKLVNKKIKTGEVEELQHITKSLTLKNKEQDELYANFDDAFLHLFPDFIEKFNALLQDDKKIVIGENGHLTTELRIFALIRLGIEDSSRIAEFLHYSVNTIYNYRARVKNFAKDNREEFEMRVKSIDSIL